MIYKLLLLSQLCFCAAAQAQNSFTGSVTDTAGQPLAFASVVLLLDSTYISGTATDEHGRFRISCSCIEGKQYKLHVSLVGFQSTIKNFLYPDTSLLAVTLKEDKQTLGAVTVTAQKPLVTRRSDRYVINVENSFLATGNSALDVLQKSPGLWIGSDGSIRIKGNQQVTVMINDVVQRMSEQELAEYLKSIKSEDINRIEIIQNPASEYEASGSGGIIHIILKSGRKNGLNGSVNGQYRQQGKKELMGVGNSLDYKLNTLLLSGSYTFASDNSDFNATSDIIYPDKSLYHTSTHINNSITRSQYRLGGVYEPSKNHSIGLQTIGTINKFVQPFHTQIDYKGNLPVTGIALSDRARRISQRSITLNYAWKLDSLGSLLKFISDYTQGIKADNTNFSATYSDNTQNSIYRNKTPNTTTIYSVQVDYTQNLKNKTQLQLGAKYVATNRDNKVVSEDFINNDWETNTGRSNHFLYNENIAALYASVEKTIRKTNIKVGLRTEQTFSKGTSLTTVQSFSKTYFGLFPSVFVNHTLEEAKGNSLFFNFARRLRRPDFNELNPYRLQLDNYSIQIGNPELQPQYSSNFQIGYIYHNNYSIDIYCTSTRNIIAFLTNPLVNNVIEYQYQNFNTSTSTGLDLTAPMKLSKIWTSSNSFSVYHLSYSIDNFSIDQTSFSAKSVHTINLKKLMDIDAVADYRSSYVYANSRIPDMFFFDLGFTKKVLKEKGKIRLYFTDVFNTLRDKAVTKYNNTEISFYQKRPTRTASLSFSYNFSSGKEFNRKNIEQSNNEERNRIGN